MSGVSFFSKILSFSNGINFFYHGSFWFTPGSLQFLGIRDHWSLKFGDQGSEKRGEKRDHLRKNIPRYDPANSAPLTYLFAVSGFRIFLT